jgi:hypothetical protein
VGDANSFGCGYQVDRAFQALPDPFPGGAIGAQRIPALGVRYAT